MTVKNANKKHILRNFHSRIYTTVSATPIFGMIRRISQLSRLLPAAPELLNYLMSPLNTINNDHMVPKMIGVVNASLIADLIIWSDLCWKRKKPSQQPYIPINQVSNHFNQRSVDKATDSSLVKDNHERRILQKKIKQQLAKETRNIMRELKHESILLTEEINCEHERPGYELNKKLRMSKVFLEEERATREIPKLSNSNAIRAQQNIAR